MPEETNGNGAPHAGPDPELQALARTFRALESDIMLARATFMRQAGITFNGQRDEYEIYGYDRQITVGQYREAYARGGIAGAIVDVMPDATWRGVPAFELIEKEESEDYTEFEQAWVDLEQKHQIIAKLQRVDKLSRLSTYGVLLIGAKGELSEPLPQADTRGLLYLRAASGGGGPEALSATRSSTVYDVGDIIIKEYDTNSQSERYGLPSVYQLRSTADLSPSATTRYVHWTRIHHVAEGLLDNEVFGVPALERVWNLLIDLHKVTGGGAEAYFLRANQGLHLDVDKDMEQRGPNGESDLAVVIASLKQQAEAYKHQLDRWIRTKGVKVTTLGSDVANFSPSADAIITQIAGAKRIPKRILTGAEMGELASSQDRENFRDMIVGRQAQYAGPYIVRPLVDRLIEFGYLPKPKKGPQFYDVKWPHIQVLTEAEKSAGAQAWMATNQAAKNAGLQPVFTEAETRDKWYSMAPMTDEQKAEIEDAKRKAMELAQEMAPEPAPVAEGKFPRAAASWRGAGDVPGHPFRGNQWTAGEGSGAVDRLKKDGFVDLKHFAEPVFTNTAPLVDKATDAGRGVRTNVDLTKGFKTEQELVGADKVKKIIDKFDKDKFEQSDIRFAKNEQTGELTLTDGNHRVVAALLRGDKSVKAKVVTLPASKFKTLSDTDEELVRVLAEAIEAGNTKVVAEILGVPFIEPTEPGGA